NFTSKTDQTTGASLYAATNVEAFLGDGPANSPNAIGVKLTNGTVGVAKFADGSFAIHATGDAALVGMPGLTLTGSLTLDVNQTGHPVDEMVTLSGSNTSVHIHFTSGAFEEQVTGTGLSISAAGIFTLTGDVKFSEQPSGRVDVKISPTSDGNGGVLPVLTLSIPINGTLTQLVSLGGSTSFSFGDGLGFQLQSFVISTVSIFGHQLLNINVPSASAPPTAELAAPYDTQNMSVTQLNNSHHIDVVFTDNSGTGLNVGAITGQTAKLTLSGAAAQNVILNPAATQPDALNNPGLFEFSFTGAFTVPCPDPTQTTVAACLTDPYNAVKVQFNGASFSDNQGTGNDASAETFYLYQPPNTNAPATNASTTTAPVVPKVHIASPLNNVKVSVDTMLARPYVDVAIDPGVAGATVNLQGTELTLKRSDTGQSYISLGATPVNCNPLDASHPCRTFRYSWQNPNVVFAAGEVDVAIANTWTATPQGSNTASIKGIGGFGSFTVTSSNSDMSSSSDSADLNQSSSPISIKGPSIGLANTSFNDGKLLLTIAISANEADLAFGDTSDSGITAKLTGIIATFEVQIDLLKALADLQDLSALPGAFSFGPGFTLNVAGLSVVVPDAFSVTASTVHVQYDPTYKAADHNGAPQTLLTASSLTISIPKVGITGLLSNLTVFSDGFQLGSASVDYKGPNNEGIDLGSIVHFDDLVLRVTNFRVTFSGGGVQFG
ncbi:MAG TPA: hypothetical protein VNZ26_30655, partial [Vicinamibacterales bacterium]|nr:hypothetical protein [Vicinamibacterales bacterium]